MRLDELSNDIKRANKAALADGSRIPSAYTVNNHRIWIITEAVEDDGHRHAVGQGMHVEERQAPICAAVGYSHLLRRWDWNSSKGY